MMGCRSLSFGALPGLLQALKRPLADIDLVALASSDDLSSLENAWTQAISEPGDIDIYTNVIATLCERDLPGKALSLASDMIEAMAAKDRTRDARRIAAVIVANRVHNDKLAQRHFELIESQDGTQSWFTQICELSNLSAGNITAPALTDYEKFRQFTEGHVLYLRAGWGEGLVTEFRADTCEIVIDFVSGREREMPLQAAIESLQTLPADDLRSMRILRGEELERLTKEEPSVLIRKAAAARSPAPRSRNSSPLPSSPPRSGTPSGRRPRRPQPTTRGSR